jgi:predicted transcriptional regulator
MKLHDIINDLSLEVKTCQDGLQKEITGAYVSDLLSDVMAKSNDGNVWITLQTHLNIVAIADMKGLAGIIIVGNRPLQDDVIQKAEATNITILSTPLSAFEAAGKLYQLLN